MEQNNQTNFTVKENFIFVSGIVDAEGADKLVEAMAANIIFTLDFSEVSEIKFAGLRSLLRCRQGGKRFSIINAADSVAERFEDTGVSSFISVCRKPKPLQMEKYTEFGASFLSKAFNSADGDAMIKVYGQRVPKWMVAQEKAVARAVMLFGLPTPLVGTLYEDGDKMGLDFERIEGKRSFSRIISEEPERLEEISKRFARMTKKLHTTECDTALFNNRKDFYLRAALTCDTKGFTKEEQQKILAFVQSIPDATTCLHGDLQISNVITDKTGKDDLWIDLSDFGYGYPMLDMGMWYFLSNLNEEKRAVDLFHLGMKDMRKVWNVFVEEYFDVHTPDAVAAVEAEVQKFAALHMFYLGCTYGFEPILMDYVRLKLL